jgi:hypothetical protein
MLGRRYIYICMATIGGDEGCQEHWASLKRCRVNVEKMNVTDVGEHVKDIK